MAFDQHLHAENVAKRFHVNKTSMTLIAAGVKPLSKEYGHQNAGEKEQTHHFPLREAVGALVWTTAMLSFAAHNLAEFCNEPDPVHRKAAIKAL